MHKTLNSPYFNRARCAPRPAFRASYTVLDKRDIARWGPSRNKYYNLITHYSVTTYKNVHFVYTTLHNGWSVGIIHTILITLYTVTTYESVGNSYV